MLNNHILLIDDKQSMIDELKNKVQKCLESSNIKIDITHWRPNSERDGNPAEKISELLSKKPLLVVTDVDLTENGFNGFYGTSIVKSCQNALIPICEFSVNEKFKLPDSPNLFNIYLTSDFDLAAREIASIYLGFKQIRDYFNQPHDFEEISYATSLANLLKRDDLYYEFAKYIESFDKVNQFIIDITQNSDKKNSNEVINHIFFYVVGHVLLNTILRYPGPIISEKVLCAYMAVKHCEGDKLAKIFKDAFYCGPFDNIDKFYWLGKVDNIVIKHKSDTDEIENIGEFNQTIVKSIDPSIESLECEKSNCRVGGFYCPFKMKTVCDSENCSIFSDRWLPVGANMCRISKEYFDEWEPLFRI